MKQTIHQIDAFASQVFQGNPAAVCVMDFWPEDILMQKIAQENNLAETAFTVKEGDRYTLRWFTPKTEVALCGHATLATAYVLFNSYGHQEDIVRFYSPRSGELLVEQKESDLLSMTFPKDDLQIVKAQSAINDALGKAPLETYRGKTDYMLVYASQRDIENITPNFFLLAKLDCRGAIITAPGNEVDFVSRFFAPQCGIPEDSVTGSAHTTLAPYWSKTLGKAKLLAKQLSPRGGDLLCEHLGDTVKISGKAVPYLVGEITI